MDTPSPTPPSGGSDDKIWILLCHLSVFFGFGIILPVIVILAKRQDSPLVVAQAKEALNFHISIYLYAIISGFLCLFLIGIPMLIVVGLGALICPILACVKASNGEFYRYPLTIRLVK